MQFGCLTGPKFFNLDGTLSKAFTVTERVKTEFKMAAYNATNRLNRGDPNTDIYSSHVWTGTLPGLTGRKVRPAGRHVRRWKQRPPSGTRTEDHISRVRRIRNAWMKSYLRRGG